MTAKSGQVVRRLRKTQPKQRQVGRSRARNSASVSRSDAFSLGPSGLPMLRTSERLTFRRCHWKWWMEFEERVKPQVDVPPLRFGGLIHGALGSYYKPGIRRGPHPAITFEELYEADLTDAAGQTKNYSKPEIDQIWSEHRDLGLNMLNGYIDHWGKDDEWKVLATEYPFKVVVRHPVRGTPWFWYTGIVDGVWENRSNKRIVIPDHKTAKSITLQYLQMDDQATAYWTWGFDAIINSRLIPPQTRLDGMLFNFLRKTGVPKKGTDEDGFVRNKPTKAHYLEALNCRTPSKLKISELESMAKRRGIVVLGEVSKVQPAPRYVRQPIYRDWYERETARNRVLVEMEDMERIKKFALRPDGAGPPMEAYKNPSQFNCAGCWLFDICELHDIGQDWQEVKTYTTTTWDPYAAHEIREAR